MLPADPKKPSTRTTEPTVSQPEAVANPVVGAELTPQVPPALSAAPSLGAMLHAFRRCWRVAIPVAVVLGLLAGAITLFFMPPQYVSTVVVRITNRSSLGSLEDEGNFASVQKAYVAVLKSHEVLSEAIEKSRVNELYGTSYSTPQLQKQLTTAFLLGPELLTIGLSGSNPEALATLLNTLSDVFAQKMNEAEEARVKTRIAQLRRRLQIDERRDVTTTPSLAEQLREKRLELANAWRAAGLDDNATRQSKLDQARLLLQTTQANASARQLARVGLESALEAKQARLKNLPTPIVTDAEVLDSLKGDAVLTDLDAQIKAKIQEIEKFRVAQPAQFNRLTRNLREQLKSLQQQRRDLIEEAREALVEKARVRDQQLLQREIIDLREKVEIARREEELLNQEVKRLLVQVQNYSGPPPKLPPEVQTLQDQVQQLERENTRIGEEIASLEGSLPLPPRVRRHNDAFLPNEKDYSKAIKYASGAAVLFFGLGLAGISLLEANRRRINASEEVSQGLGLRVVGTLPLLPANARDQVAHPIASFTANPSAMNESVDAIRTVLLHGQHAGTPRIILVTSAAGGEGKTTLASHLACSLARAWRKTLLIDGDLRNPGQHLQFEQPAEPGLCEVLRQEVAIDEAIHATPISRLWLMPAGHVDPHALQALAQDNLAALFEQIKAGYDFLVVDTSPVLPVPDALLLAKQADVVLLSIMRDVSRMPAVYQAQRRLESLGLPLMGTVVIGEKTETYGRTVAYPTAQKS